MLSVDFQPRQIVCLEHQDTRLYAEVVQVVVSRQVCWVRPMLLAQSPAESHFSSPPLVTDLRSEADLLWPLSSFRFALDTELIPLLAQLLTPEPPPEPNPAAGKQLSQFIHLVWQDYKDQL